MATDRRFFLALTVKNEAPNLWEWVAYHRAIGFTDIAIYQNDSVDGTQKMLRTMEKHGFIQYFNNPSHNKGWQNKAYRRASRLPEYPFTRAFSLVTSRARTSSRASSRPVPEA